MDHGGRRYAAQSAAIRANFGLGVLEPVQARTAPTTWCASRTQPRSHRPRPAPTRVGDRSANACSYSQEKAVPLNRVVFRTLSDQGQERRGLSSGETEMLFLLPDSEPPAELRVLVVPAAFWMLPLFTGFPWSMKMLLCMLLPLLIGPPLQ